MKNYFYKVKLFLFITILISISPGCSDIGESKVSPGAGKDWAYTGGTEKQIKYSELDQINKTNVSKLEVAWVYNSETNKKYF